MDLVWDVFRKVPSEERGLLWKFREDESSREMILSGCLEGQTLKERERRRQ